MNHQTHVTILLCALLTSAAFGQGIRSDVSKRGTTAAPFLSIGQGARATGLGSAFVAIADDPSAMYWNPSGIADLSGVQVIVDHTSWFAGITYDYVGATLNAGSYGTVGVNLTASGYGEMDVRTVDKQEGTGEVFGVSDVAVGLSYALKLTDNFAIGFNPKYVFQKIWKMSASAFAVDIGVKYRTPFRGVTLGMAVSNFGTKLQMQGTNALVLYDSDPSSSGNNGRIPADLATDEWELPLNFRVGVAYDVPIGDLGRMTLAVDAVHPSDNYESLNIGGEYLFNNLVYLRGGWKSLGITDAEERYTLGIGVREYVVGNVQFSLDYAYQDFGRLTNIQKVTLGVGF